MPELVAIRCYLFYSFLFETAMARPLCSRSRSYGCGASLYQPRFMARQAARPKDSCAATWGRVRDDHDCSCQGRCGSIMTYNYGSHGSLVL